MQFVYTQPPHRSLSRGSSRLAWSGVMSAAAAAPGSGERGSQRRPNRSDRAPRPARGTALHAGRYRYTTGCRGGLSRQSAGVRGGPSCQNVDRLDGRSIFVLGSLVGGGSHRLWRWRPRHLEEDSLIIAASPLPSARLPWSRSAPLHCSRRPALLPLWVRPCATSPSAQHGPVPRSNQLSLGRFGRIQRTPLIGRLLR